MSQLWCYDWFLESIKKRKKNVKYNFLMFSFIIENEKKIKYN